MLVYSILEALARTELRGLGSGDLDRGAGLGITAGAGSTLGDREGTETDEGDVLTLLKGGGHGFNESVDSFSSLGLGKIRLGAINSTSSVLFISDFLGYACAVCYVPAQTG